MKDKGVRARSVWVLLATVLGIGVTTSLGMWQLRRGEVKQQLHDTRMLRQQLPALGNAALACQPQGWQQQEQMQAKLTGHWLHAYTVVLDNRSMAGRTGFVVLTPLRLEPAPVGHGCVGVEQAVLVQRGWLPRDGLDRTRVPEIARPQGLVTVPVRLTFAPSKMLSLQTAEPREQGVLRQNVDLLALSQEWHLPLLPGSLQQTDDETPLGQQALSVEPKLLRQWWQPVADVGKHQAYAAQWFLMALTMLGLYGWFQWWRPSKAIDE